MAGRRGGKGPNAAEPEGLRQWHRFFGLAWVDRLTDEPVTIEMEKDLAIRKQLLDLLIISQEGEGVLANLPDGFEAMTRHNLITFKSYQEGLTGWALCELVAHHVNYRKLVSDRPAAYVEEKDLLQEVEFSRFAVIVRTPHNLLQRIARQQQGEGIYDLACFDGQIRLIVINELALKPNNAMLLVFSNIKERAEYGREHYVIASEKTPRLLNRLFEKHKKEGLDMPYTMEDFLREDAEQLLAEMSIEQRLKGLPAEEILKRLPADEFLKRLSVEELLRGLSKETLAKLLEQAQQQQAGESASSPPARSKRNRKKS